MMKSLFSILLGGVFLVSCSKSKLAEEQSSVVCNNSNSLYVLSGQSDKDLPCLIPQTEKKALILYFMSTDCPGCGSWGTSTFHRILEENPDQTEGLQVHIKYSDPWIIPGFSDSLIARYNPRYTPFVMVEDFVPAGTVQVNNDPAYTSPRAKQEIDKITAETAEIAPALALRIQDGKVQVHYGGLFQTQTSESYSFGFYLMEDGLEYNQAGSSVIPYIHDNTVREVLGSPWGVEIEGGLKQAGDIFTGMMETELIGYWNPEKLHVLGVIWKTDTNGKRRVVNTIHAR